MRGGSSIITDIISQRKRNLATPYVREYCSSFIVRARQVRAVPALGTLVVRCSVYQRGQVFLIEAGYSFVNVWHLYR